MLPPIGRDGFKQVAFPLKNNKNRVNSFRNRKLFQNKILMVFYNTGIFISP
jgi:hypothetical protein